MKLIILMLSLLSTLWVHAQEKKVTIDRNAKQANGGNAIPAGNYFAFEGAIPEEVVWVDVQLFSGRTSLPPVYSGTWKRATGNNTTMFSLPVDRKLRFGSSYRLQADYYAVLTGNALSQFRQRIASNIDYYLDARINVKKDELKMGAKTDRIMSELNDIVSSSFQYYTNPHTVKFPGFSDLVKIKLQQIADADLDDAAYNVSPQDSSGQLSNVAYANELQASLHNMIVSELDNYLAYGVVVKTDEVVLNNLETEKSRGYLPINVGYGAVAFNTDFDDLETDQQPYVGISIPFGNPRFSKVLANTSLSFGIFLKDFTNAANQKVTGPVINKPSYLALGYKIFEFIKLNAGVTALSTEKVSLNNIRTDNVQLKPFVGISAELNLSLGFGKNR